jgi:2-polyprenyl-6-methoxyphenol hydroxylase-like FAD-dependent oxidoreductase
MYLEEKAMTTTVPQSHGTTAAHGGEGSDTGVLIAGAGPTGLMMACQLARFGIPFRIIEKNSGPTTQSRALAIQARSLELFAQMGIADKAVQQGKIARGVNYVVNGQITQRISLEGHGRALTAFPYLLILDQSRTEQLLIDYLERHGHSVEWQTELVSFAQDQNGVSATLKRTEGEDGSRSVQEEVHAGWLAGADGAKSVVRHTLGIPFGGRTYRYSLYVLDCKVDFPFKDDEGYIAFSDTSFAAFFPMTEGRCRIISILPEGLSDKAEVTFDDVARDFASRMQMNVMLSDPKWISVYHSHHRYVATFRKGRCFLAGDAAHIHSPVGAQGMNTGLQDAHNLAWKLALVISGEADERLLDTYNEERLPLAKSLVRTTDRLFSIVLNKSRLALFWITRVAPKALGLALTEKHLARFAFTMVSQIGIRYRNSRLSEDASFGDFPGRAPKPGDRLPYVRFGDGPARENIQDRIQGPAFHMFVFPGPAYRTETEPLIAVAGAFGDAVVVDTIPLAAGTEGLYKAFGVPKGGCYLVRPDMYVAYRSAGFEPRHLEQYLDRFLVRGTSGRDTAQEQFLLAHNARG